VRGWGSYCKSHGGGVLAAFSWHLQLISENFPSFYNIHFVICLTAIWTVNSVSDEEYNVIVVCRRFRVTYCFHLQVLGVSLARSMKQITFCLACLTYSSNLSTKQYVPLKRRRIFMRLHGVTSRMIVLCVVITVGTPIQHIGIVCVGIFFLFSFLFWYVGVPIVMCFL
jgi:hypothetical protein